MGSIIKEKRFTTRNMELLMNELILKENEAMNSLLIERDEEIEKLKKEVARLKASNKRWYNIYKDLRKEIK
jgi:predicted nuclease with TOPRIM domain